MIDREIFRKAIEARDLDYLMTAFSDDAVLHSPITHQPFEGRAAVRELLGIIFEVFQDFRYTDELEAHDGTRALIFRARVRDRAIEGIDLLRFDESGRIRDLTVMIRPRSGLEAALEEVAPRLVAARQGR